MRVSCGRHREGRGVGGSVAAGDGGTGALPFEAFPMASWRAPSRTPLTTSLRVPVSPVPPFTPPLAPCSRALSHLLPLPFRGLLHLQVPLGACHRLRRRRALPRLRIHHRNRPVLSSSAISAVASAPSHHPAFIPSAPSCSVDGTPPHMWMPLGTSSSDVAAGGFR